MSRRNDPEAVLIIGAYGTGKSALAAEMAELLEEDGRPYAAIDLDWLAWTNAAATDASAANRLFLRNLSALVANDVAAGARLFVLAGAYSDRPEFDDLVATLSMPLRVVRLTVPLDEIVRRLRSNVSAGRHDALENAEEGIVQAELVGVGERTVSNDRPIRDTAAEVLEWLGWL
jgi:hypothetical protein